MRFFRVILFLVLFAWALMGPVPVYGQKMDFGTRPSSRSGPVDISAESLEYDKAANVYIAKGRVEIREGTRVLNADFVRYNKDTEDVFAEGKVVFREEGDVITSEKMELNLATKTGTIENGKVFIKDGNFSIVGSNIEKLGENVYQIKKGQFTTCDIEGPAKPAWKFTASEANVTIDGYAKTKDMRFHILDKPVFYLPAGFFPVKTDRQSGFLMPELITSSRDGVKITESFFWAISKDKDATFYSQFIGARGLRVGSEFRYALREDLKGGWNFWIINDSDYNGTRYELKGKHEQVFLKDFTFKTDIDYVSDQNVILDFAPTPALRAENLLKSTAYVEKPFTQSLLTVEAAYFRNLIVRDNDSTFKYLPHATFFTEYIPIIKNRFYTDFYSDFTSFYRERGDRFTRWGIEPRLKLPYTWNGVNMLLSGTLYETAYLIDRVSTEEGSSTTERHTARLEGTSNVQLIRNYNTDFLNLGQMQSVIKPQLKYTFIPNSSSSGIPSIDPYDRISQQNSITYSFNHYLYGLSPRTARELSVLEIQQTYGLSGNLKSSLDYKGYGNRFSDINAKLTLFPWKNLAFINQTVWNTSGQGFASALNKFNYTEPNRYFLSLYHTYTRDLNNNQANFDVGGTYKTFDLRSHIRYSFEDQTWIDTAYQIVYHPQCWSISLALIQSQRPKDTTFRLAIDLAGITRNIGAGSLFPVNGGISGIGSGSAGAADVGSGSTGVGGIPTRNTGKGGIIP